MQTWQEAPEALRRAIEALELVPADEQLAALRGLAEAQGMDLAEEVARILVARKVARRRVAQMSESQIRGRAQEVMQAAVDSGQLTPQAMAEMMAAADLRAKLVEFVANGYLRASPTPSEELRRMLRGETGADSLGEDAE
jgi:hypothetical protein